MLGLLSKYFKQVSVLRRLLFAIIHLPEDVPKRWDLCVQFANNGLNTGLSADIAKMLSENIQALDAEAFTSDHTLHQELMQIPNKKSLGVVLISSRETCLRCHSKVSVRKDRPASITVYDKIGTVPGTHFHKYCSNRGCGYTYYYGYYTTGSTCNSQSSSHTLYEPDWESLPYFISSRETAFSITLLRQFNSEIVLGQMSFKQCAEVYNHLHQCDMKQAQECEQ